MPIQTYWPQQYYSTTATTTNCIPVNTQYYCNTANSPQTIWQNWNTSANSTIYVQSNTNYPTYANQVWYEWVHPTTMTYGQSVQTPEEVRAAREVYERQNRERMERRSAARARARTLLSEFLDDEQKAELEHHGRFFVTGSRGRRYCIRAEGQSGNVDLLKPDGSVQARLCCHPRSAPGEPFYEPVPEADAWLVQMIEIRHDEDHFLRTANVHRGRLPALI